MLRLLNSRPKYVVIIPLLFSSRKHFKSGYSLLCKLFHLRLCAICSLSKEWSSDILNIAPCYIASSVPPLIMTWLLSSLKSYLGKKYWKYVMFILLQIDSLLRLLFLLQCLEWCIWETLILDILNWVIVLSLLIMMKFVSFHTSTSIA